MNGRFQKGYTPWNKGKHGYKNNYPEVRKEKVELSESHRQNIKESVLRGNNHPMWKGKDVGYTALHEWVENQLGKPNECEHCLAIDAKKFEWANKSGNYLREVSDWIRLCTSCHRKQEPNRGSHETFEGARL